MNFNLESGVDIEEVRIDPIKSETSNLDESVVLEHVDGRELIANMVKGEKIAQGSMGNIYSVKINMSGKEIPFILKEYKGYWDPSSSTSKENAEKAFVNYKLAKDNGLKVFKTFRLIKDRGSILMTNGLSDEMVCVSSNGRGSTTLESFEGKKLKSISNFDELLDKIFQQTDNATLNKINIDRDSFLFLIDKQKNSVDFVIGDMDFIKKIPDNAAGDYGNRQAGYEALGDMIKNNVEDSSELLGRLEAKYKKEK